MTGALQRAWNRFTPTTMVRTVFVIAGVMFVLWLLWAIYFLIAYVLGLDI